MCVCGEKQIFFSENDYCAMLRAYTLLHAAMFTLHWEAFAEWLIQEEKDMDYIICTCFESPARSSP